MDTAITFSAMNNDYLLLYPGYLWLVPVLLLLMLLRPWFVKQKLVKPAQQSPQNSTSPITSVRHPYAQTFFSATHQSVSSRNKRSENFGKKNRLHFLTWQNIWQSNKLLKQHKMLLIFFSYSLMLLALAQPVKLDTNKNTSLKVAKTSADIMLIIDTSISMVIKDYQLDGQRVDRMTMTQVLLDRFSRRFSGKHIGIVVLGEHPQVLLAPSSDKKLVRFLIHQLKTTVSGRQAALGDAIAIAVENISNSPQKDKTVIVLISSADSPGGQLSPIAGVERAIDAGITLHSIAIGSSTIQASQSGELIHEPADLKLLKQMAEMSGGESFHATDVNAMDAALDHIEQRHLQITTHKQSNKTHGDIINIADNRHQQALYQWPLLSSLLLLILINILPHQNKINTINKPSTS